MKRLHVRHILLFVIAALLAGCAGWYAHIWYSLHTNAHASRRVALKGYEFTSPLLDVELPKGVNIDSEPIPFKYIIEAYIKKAVDSGQARNVAVYYRDLHDGPWFGIHEDMEFNPASMMKVPVMIAWLKRAEKTPLVLRQKMTFRASDRPVPQPYTKPAQEIESGKSYTVDELLRYMMNYSDNKATSLLYKTLNDKELADVLDSMDVNNNPRDEDNFISVHGFSGFFRILYNAAYLNREMSERALQLLSLQDFPLGIAAGVPKGTKVAAKFGEIVPEHGGGDVQVHEFGIVYHPHRPFILGIMTRGADFTKQAGIIREISRIVYIEVDSSI